MSRGVIDCKIPHGYDFSRFGASGAIAILNRVITKMLALRTPREPATQLILGSLHGGTSFNTIAKTGTLRYELRSEQAGLVGELTREIESILGETRSSTGVELTLQEVARRHNGGLDYKHPLLKACRDIMKSLEVKPIVAPSTGELAALIEQDIPGVTLGLTRGQNRHMFDEQVEIEPIFTGLAQLIAVLRALDGGICHEEA